MNATLSSATGFTPVGAFVKDLATELGKSPTTLTNALRKLAPHTLVKRKNANNRLANFVEGEGVQKLRSRYQATASDNTSLLQEIERLREENKRLKAEVEELKHHSLIPAKPEEVDIGDLLEELERTERETAAVIAECKQRQEQTEKLQNAVRHSRHINSGRRARTTDSIIEARESKVIELFRSDRPKH